MSYVSPYINQLNDYIIGVDAPIESIRRSLEQLPWLTKSFGRAYQFKEVINDKQQRIPKVYAESGEYVNTLPNDTFFTKNLAASSFIALKGAEDYVTFNYENGSMKKATLSVIFWCNLKLIDDTKNFIFTELLKNDVEHILKINPYVFEILEWVDEKAEEVFDTYDLQYGNEVLQYLMYPYAGFRVDVTVNYPEACGPEFFRSDGTTAGLQSDITFFVGTDGWPQDGDATYTSTEKLIGKRVIVWRNHIKQALLDDGSGFYYSFNNIAGTVTFHPLLKERDLIEIMIE